MICIKVVSPATKEPISLSNSLLLQNSKKSFTLIQQTAINRPITQLIDTSCKGLSLSNITSIVIFKECKKDSSEEKRRKL